ncbi:MAG: hypothetical protein KIH69_003305 [Anaerolineae bacterium]|nr:hypothetical protein [Anaerolineae bacterium]
MMTLSVDQLSAHCAQEANKYLRNQNSDDRFCLELFRRAALQNDEAAWGAVLAQYKNQIYTWIKRTAQYLPDEDYDDLWAMAFEKFLRYAPDVIRQTSSLAVVLGRLRDCATGTAIDYLRSSHFKHTRPDISHIKPTQPAQEDADEAEVTALERKMQMPSFESENDCADLREKIMSIAQKTCRTEIDRVILSEIYVYDKPPREVFGDFPQYFVSITDVHKAHRNLKDRLSRDDGLKTLLPLYQDCE